MYDVHKYFHLFSEDIGYSGPLPKRARNTNVLDRLLVQDEESIPTMDESTNRRANQKAPEKTLKTCTTCKLIDIEI